MSKKGQESAFPIEWENTREGFKDVEFGISIRTYIAVKAMQSLIINATHSFTNDNAEGLSRNAYKIADEMLEREGE